jgi:glycerate dehydrogenase
LHFVHNLNQNSNMKITFLDAYTSNHGDLEWKDLESLGEVKIYDRTIKSEIISRTIDAEVIITNKVVFDRELISQLPQLKYICVAATGYNNVDLEAAREHGVTVSNVVGYSTSAVAQHVFSLILSLVSKSWAYGQEFHDKVWANCEDFSYFHDPILELKGKMLGIYGFGKIGQAVARIALAFDMKIQAVHKHPERDKMEGVEFVDWDSLIKSSDILSLHAPLTNENKGLMNQKVFEEMKNTAILINTSRGPVINESDLASALQKGQIKGAGMDVLSMEPPSAENPLIGVPNCLVTPHHAWASQEARTRLLAGIVDNIIAYSAGKPINQVS